MTPSWQEFLAQAGAHGDAGLVSHFGAPETERRAALDGDILVPLKRGLLRFEGSDAARLLHGQLSQDIQNLAEDRSALAGFANVQGRLRAIVRVFRAEGAYWLQLPSALMEAVHAEFRKFAPLYRQLKLSEATDELVLLGLSGPGAEAKLAALLGAAPAETGAAVTARELTAIRLPGGPARFQLLGREAAVRAAWPELAAGATLAGEGAWELTEIAMGLPEVQAETAQTYLPLHINLQLVDGIHWKKGCYTGQEIIARMHYRSTLKRHMYRAEVSAAACPAPGAPVFAAGAPVGTVVRAARGPEGRVHLLAELPIEQREHGEIRLGEPDGPILSFDELPYALVASYQSGQS